ncbi:hypothetical protein C2E21_9330 [Chlorella sorokiniana]|uniref:Uncharacterized protein n=1 Tax=Chlorella sorokiniana TaxID=3076 RepID=A0A2P6TBQ5_CHLSO|nr:hypothetical protein C2E21_9330 [Chlorella sorokiniana]|eukprot:PRW18310.1 hypothetical protein C2E21_9330 [Chlorella sorokiniana]
MWSSAKAFQDIARQLSRLTDKQLARLTPLVGEEVVDAVALAARIDRRNQGRQRQESLVARLLRESVEDDALLQAAIDSVRTGQGVIANPGVERQLELWMAALLSGDAEATTQVFSLVQASGGDLQQVRQLLRQAQQVEAAPAAAGEQEDSSSSSSNGSSAAGGSSSPAGAPRPTAKARAASKQLRKLLQPLAAAEVGEEEEDE